MIKRKQKVGGKNSSGRFFCSSGLLALALMMPFATLGRAADLTWDPGNSGNGGTIDAGSGAWNLTLTNWNAGSSNMVWTQTSSTSPLNNAIFGGADGSYVVTLGTQVAVTNATFANSGYSLSGSTLYVFTAGIVGVAAGKTATINSAIGTPNNVTLLITNDTGSTLNLGGGFTSGPQPTFRGAGTNNITAGTYPMSVPQFNTAVINQSGGTVNLSGDASSGNWIDYNAGQNVNYTINGGTLNLNGSGAGSYLSLGRNSGATTGTLTVQAGGTVNVGTTGPGRISFAIAGNASGKLDIQGGAITVGTADIANQIYLFPAGSTAGNSAVMTQSGGVMTAQGIQFGAASGTYAAATASLTLTGGSLYLGSLGITEGAAHATDSVTFSGGIVGAAANWSSAMNISLGSSGGPVTFQAADAASVAHDITLSGALSGSQGFTKTGGGTLTLSGANTYSGSTAINAGTVLLVGSGSAASSSGLSITNGGALTLMNSASANLNSRVSNTAAIAMNGGAFSFANDASVANFSETAGALIINSGVNTVTAYPAAGGQTSTLTFSSLVHNGGSVNFLIDSAGTSQNRVFFTTPPTLGSWITVNGSPAAYDSTNGLQSALTYDVDIAALGSTITNAPVDNLRINFTGSGGNIQLSATTTAINSLQQNTTTAATVNTDGTTFQVNQIAINAGLASLTIGASPGAGALTAGSMGGNLTLVNNSGFAPGLVINTVLADNIFPSSLTVAGSGTVTLAAPNNSYSGGTTISNATLAVTTGTTATMGYTDMDGNLSVKLGGAGTALPMSSLTFGGTPQLAFDVGAVANSASPLINVSGNLAMNANVSVNVTNASRGSGVLLKYAGSRNGAGRFVAGHVPSGLTVIDDPVSQAIYYVFVSGPMVIVPPHNTNEIIVAVATPQQYGAVGDGVTDDTAAFQSAMKAANNSGGYGGGVVYVPAGTYCFSNTLTIPSGVTLHGDWTDWSQGTNGVVGTLFKVYAGSGQSNGTPFITLAGGALNGVSIWYPNQNPASITPYPFTVKISNSALVQDVALINSYQGITGPGDRHIFSTVIGSPLYIGITLDRETDISHQEDVRFSPDFWPASKLPGAPAVGGPHAAWMRANGTAELLYRVDGEGCMDLNISGYHVGVWGMSGTNAGFTGAPSLSFYGGYISNCATAFLDGSGATDAGIQFTRMALDGDIAVDRTSTPNNAAVNFHTCQLTGRSGIALRQTGGSSSTMQLQNCNISGTVKVDGGVIDVVNSTITTAAGSNQCMMASGAIYAAFTGCTFRPTRTISNAADARRLVLDGRRASTSAMPVVRWSDIKTNSLSYRPAKLDLFVATAAPWNAPTDGVTDATAAIQAALNAASTNGGGIVYLPAGKYYLSNTLDVPSGVELLGSYPSVHNIELWDANTNVDVTVLQPYGGAGTTNGPPAVALEANSGIVGLTIQYELQNTNCTPYPPTIQGRGGNIYALGVLCANPYWYVDLNTYTCTNHFIQQVSGWALRYGFTIGNGSSGTVLQCQGNPVFWRHSGFSASLNISSWQPIMNSFVFNNLEFFQLGNCSELLVKNFNFGNHIFMHCVDQNGQGPWVNGIITQCDAAVECFQFDAAAPCQINIVNPEWMVTLAGGNYSTNYGVVSLPTFQGTARFFNSPLWGSRKWDYLIQGGDVGFELVRMSYLSANGTKVDGGVLHLINCGFEGNTASSYTVPFNSASPGVAGKLSEIIGCYAWTGVTNSRVNVNNPINIWGNFGINNLVAQTPFNVTSPLLQISPNLTAGEFSILWTNSMGAFNLYSTPNLSSSMWTLVSNTPYFATNRWSVTDSIIGKPQLFYRLGP